MDFKINETILEKRNSWNNNDSHFPGTYFGGMKINKAKAQITTTTMAVEQDKITDISASFKITVKTQKKTTSRMGQPSSYMIKLGMLSLKSKPSDIKIIKNGVLSITKNTASQVLSLSLDSLTNNTKYF